MPSDFRLQELLRLKNMTIADLVQISGVSEMTITKIIALEDSGNPRSDTLRKIAAALGVRIADLYTQEVE